jgi:hypothetical protein
VVCDQGDACHDAGVCDPQTGECSHQAKADGTSCDDGNACTQNDSCQAGACTAGAPVVCGGGDACHEAGVCNPETGQCSNAAKADGTSCSDGNACTQNDSCQAGACTSGSPVVCGGGDACHEAGVCNPETGQCVNAPKPNGTSCSDGNACTQNDSCQAGTCTPGAAVTCGGGDACHEAGVCNPQTGQCSNPAKPNGTACNADGNLCTQNDSCQAGVCTAGAPVVCDGGADQCHVASTCNPSTGQCVGTANKPNGTPCDDGNLCTQTDSCQAGVCKGFAPVLCGPGDACHQDGVCDPQSGQCSNAPKPDGTPCSDDNLCTQSDSCQAGACTGADPVLCAPTDACHVSVCRPRSGKCRVQRKQPGFQQCLRAHRKGGKGGKGGGKK